MKGKHFLKLLDFTPEQITKLLDDAADFKAKKKAGIPHKIHEGKNIVLLFEKDSTRTRCAFEVAGADLGMSVTYLGPSGSQMGKKESIADTARVLGRMYNGIEYRGFDQTIVETLAKYAGVPVWNGLTNEFHPTQILADMLTIREHFGSLEGKKLWILKTMPLDARTVLFSKAMPHIIITAPATLLASIMLGVAMGAPIEYWPFIILTPIASTVALAFMGIAINTAFPKFEFEHETQPIKQSLATFLAMVGSTVVAVLSIALTVLVSVFFSPLLAAGAALALSLLLAGGFAFLVAGPCARKYDTYCA